MSYKAQAQSALDRRAKLVNEIRSINDDTALSDAEKRERIEKIDVDIAAATAEARSFIEQGEAEAEARSLGERMGKLALPGEPEKEGEKRSAADIFADEFRSLSRGDELKIQADGGLRSAGVNTAKLTDSAWAGVTVQNSFMATVIESIREHSAILQTGPTVITTATGEKMEWPMKNGNIIAAAVAEGATYPKSKASFTRFGLDAFKYGVIAEGTREMLNDSQLNLPGIIARDIGEALADITAADFTRGNGTTAPQGVVPATVLQTTVANTAALTTDALIAHQHSVRPGYRRNATWYCSDDFVLKVRLLKDGQGRYVWQDGIQLGAPDTLLGKPVVIDTFMDTVGGGTKTPAVFGDFSRFLVRFVGGVTLSRSDEYGWDSDIVAWKGNVRVDSGLWDAAALSKIVVTA